MPIEEVMEQTTTTASYDAGFVLETTESATGDMVLNPLLGGYNFVEEETDELGVDFTKEYTLAVVPRDRVRAIGQFTTFRQQAIELADLLTSMTTERATFVLTITELLEADNPEQYRHLIDIAEFAGTSDAQQLVIAKEFLDTLTAQLTLRAAFSTTLTDVVSGATALAFEDAVLVLETLGAGTAQSLRTSMTHADAINAATRMLAAIPVELLDLLSGTDTLSLRDALQTVERLQMSDSTQVAVAASLILGLLARVTDRGAMTEKTADALVADTTLGHQLTLLAQMLDTVSAATQTQQTLVLSIEETLDAQAADELQGLSHYLENLRDYASSWVGFRLGDEDFTGWVMNTEGDMPLSEYTNYEFNSFCRVGDVYLGAADAGLYLLDGATDAGEPIESAVRTMMLDFGSPAMKRVRHAYLGYTSDGSLMLKVRTVSNGELKEQWYEAQELPAQAPREQMIQLGRGLRSRYWQFELVNVDGADFELDMLELHPVYLNRRT